MSGAKVLSLSQLKAKKYTFLEHVTDDIARSFGKLTTSFTMIVYGYSGNGKSNLLIALLKVLTQNGKCLYVSLEEGHGYSMQLLVTRHLSDEHNGKVVFADHSMTYDLLWKRLARQRSEQFIFIDSVQYWDITIKQYKALKEKFHKKTFIFISHAKGKLPDGMLANKIEYDATIKIRVDGFVGLMKSRLGGNEPYIIWEEGARRRWGDKAFEKLTGLKRPKKTKVKNEKEHKSDEKNTTDHTRNNGGDRDTLQFGGDATLDRLPTDTAELSADRVDKE